MAQVIVARRGPLVVFQRGSDGAAKIVVGNDTANAARYAGNSASSATLSQAWAEGTEPGGPGTKSAKGWADVSAASAAGVSMARGPYATTGDGLTATTNGQRFWAISGEWLQLYTNSAGSAVAVAGYITPLKTWADARFGETSDPWALESADGFIIARAAADRTFRVNWPLMLGSSVFSETAGVLRAGSLYSKDAPAITGLQFVSDDGFVLMSTSGLFNTITME